MTDTNAIPQEVKDAVAQAVPPSWRPWAFLGLSLLPFFTRYGYALYAGRGLFGAAHGFLFGTNETKNQTPPQNP